MNTEQKSDASSSSSPSNQVAAVSTAGPDPLANLIKQIHLIKEMFPGGEAATAAAAVPGVGGDAAKKVAEIEALDKLLTELKNGDHTPNVNPFPLSTILQHVAVKQQTPTNKVSSFPCEPISGSDQTQKQLLQQRLIDKIKAGAASSATTVATLNTQTSTTAYNSPIPALRMEPLPSADIQLQDVSKTLDNDSTKLLQMLLPQNTATTVTRSPQVATVAPVAKQQPPPVPSQPALDDARSRQMFENIKKQISDQSVFNLTANVYPTSNEGEGLILVVTRNKIDIHPQFGPIHVARVVITNKLYYKFFVLDKIVDRGPVKAKEISEVFWKLSDVSRHLLCPGFNQRYISKVEQTLGEKVEDITTSYCRLTAKMCTVWHQKDSKPGQYRNYHTRDLCSECLDLYHKLQFKTYSYTKMQNPVAGGGSTKREGDLNNSVINAAKKPKINGQSELDALDIGEQQLKAVLSTLVANSRVVQLNKASEGDDMGDVDILGSDCDSPAAASTVPSTVPTSEGGVAPSTSTSDTNLLPLTKDKLGDILATLNDLQRSEVLVSSSSSPAIQTSAPCDVARALLNQLQQQQSEVADTTSAPCEAARALLNQLQQQSEGADTAVAGPSEEDLLVIQED